MVYPIIMYGDPVLRKKALDIDRTVDLQTLIQDMFETMHAAKGLALLPHRLERALGYL